MDKKKIEVQEVCSANKWYLIIGIIFSIVAICLEICVIRIFFISQFVNAITMAFLLQIPCLLCLLLIKIMIEAWIHRTKFNLYYCKLENGIDIDYIKNNYSVEKISSEGILFVEKKDSSNYASWALLNGCDII